MNSKKTNVRIFQGDFIHTPQFGSIEEIENCIVVVKDGIIIGMYRDVPDAFEGLPLEKLPGFVIPGFCDMHIHAPQYPLRGMGLDGPLLPWLHDYTYPCEEKFADTAYALTMYKQFTDHLLRAGTLHAAVYATIHEQATDILMQTLSATGLRAYVGKVHMDSNCPDALRENTKESVAAAYRLAEKVYPNILPIVTPRFAPSCTPALMRALGDMADELGLPVQSHLDENMDEISLVKQLFPESKSYAHVYDEFGLFGQTPTLMAHCVHIRDEEIDLMAKRGVYAVHCPTSNLNLRSGIAPVRRLLVMGVPVCLGTDVGAGERMDMMSVITTAVKSSGQVEQHGMGNALSLKEAFYLATTAGGAFFGETGVFALGYSFDALVIDDSSLGSTDLPLFDRLSRFLYTGDDRQIAQRYLAGEYIGASV